MAKLTYDELTVHDHVIDVREPFEFLSGHLPRSINRPLSTLTKAELPEKGRVVFVCQNERRSRDAIALLKAAGKTGDFNVLGGGLTKCQEENFALIKEGDKMTVMQQTQLFIGSLLMLGAVLDWPVLIFLLGAGLFYSGQTGTCALASVLKRMPWNK